MSSTAPKQSVRRAFAMVFAMQGYAFEGLRLSQIADAVRATPSTALRDLQVLADEGIVERIPGRDDFWRLSPRLIQLAIAHQSETARLQQRVDEFNQRYTRTPG